MSDETTLPAIPSLIGDLPPQLRGVLQAIKEILEVRDGRRGNELDRFVTLRELATSGVVDTVASGRRTRVVNPLETLTDLTPPAAITGFSVVGAYASMILTWDQVSLLNYPSFSHTEVWRSDTDSIGTATQIGETTASIYSDPCGTNTGFYYWVRVVSQAGVAGPFNAVHGTYGETSPDVAYLLEQLTGQISESQLYSALAARIDLVDDAKAITTTVTDRVATAKQEAIDYGFGADGVYTSFKANEFAQVKSDASTALSIANSIVAVDAEDGIVSIAERILTIDQALKEAGDTYALASDVNRLISQVNFGNDDEGNPKTATSYIASELQTQAETFQSGLNAKASASDVSVMMASLGDINDAPAEDPTATELNPDGSFPNSVVALIKEARSVAVSANGAAVDLTNAINARLNNIGAPDSGVTVEQKFTAQADVNTGLLGQYTVKVDTNGYVSGFGLASTLKDATPYSEFYVRADRFAIGSPGRTQVIPFAVNSTETTVNGVTVPVGVFMDAAYIKNGTITNAKIGDAEIDSAKVSSLSADKITFGTMSGDRIAVDSLTADRIRTGTLNATTEIRVGDNLKISGAGWIESYSLGGFNRAGDYTRLDAGNIKLYRYVPALDTAVLYNYLTRIETGVANNGDTVAIPGYWKSQPKIVISPNTLTLYKASAGGQDQAIVCQANNIRESSSGSMQWLFDSAAMLRLAAATQTVAVNIGSGDTANNTWTSSTYTTPANTNRVSPQFTVLSTRGNGTGSYYLRSIKWRVEHWNGSSWVQGSWKTVGFGQSVGSTITDTQTYAFPSGATWQWRIYAESYDTDGTVFGTSGYTYHDAEIVSAPNFTVTAKVSNGQVLVTSEGRSTFGQSINFPGAEIYRIVYQWYVSGSCQYAGSVNGVPYGTGELYANGGTSQGVSKSFGGNFGTAPMSPVFRSYDKTGSNLSIETSLVYARAEARFSQSGSFFTTNVMVTNAIAYIYKRTLVANSTTPTNSYYLNAVTYDLVTSETLAQGTVNWVAIGD